MAIDFGDILSGAVRGAAQTVLTPGYTYSPPFSPGASSFVAPGVGSTSGSGTYRINPATGAVEKCRRRRRRRLLTPTDLSDLAALQALVGKGSSALNMAVAKAVRR